MANGLKVRFWGVRGSISCSGAEYTRYGGNTSCLEVTAGGRRLIFDAGTGMRPLGLELARQAPIDIDIYFTHTHLDHIIGLNSDGDSTNDVDVANMSFGEQRAWGDCSSDPLHGAICRAHGAGVILVGGAGNAAVDAGSFVPAAYPEVIGVSAMADFDGAPGGMAGCALIQPRGARVGRSTARRRLTHASRWSLWPGRVSSRQDRCDSHSELPTPAAKSLMETTYCAMDKPHSLSAAPAAGCRTAQCR